MSQPSDSHLVANEAIRLSNLPLTQARRELGDRIARTFQLGGYHANPQIADREAFKLELDFNSRLVSALRERGVKLWE